MKKIILLLTLLAGIGYLSGCKFIKKRFQKKQEVDTMAAYLAQMDSIRIADSIYLSQLEQTKLDSLGQGETAPADQNNNKYFIISGSFKTPSFAERYLQDMIGKGYKDSKIVQANNGFNLVSIASFPDFRSAVNEMKAIRSQAEMEIWIYIAN